MISAMLLDAGTRANVRGSLLPGMHELTYVSHRFEHSMSYQLDTHWINGKLRGAGQTVTMNPWPVPLPYACPVDYTDRYRMLAVTLWERDQYGDRWAEAPAGHAVLLPLTAINSLDRELTTIGCHLTPEEIRANPAIDPRLWIRQPFENEINACALKTPVDLTWHGTTGHRYTFVLDDNIFFTPFDFTHPERYDWVNDDGEPTEDSLSAYSTFPDGARLKLYLRPRRWKSWVRTIAHYVYVSFFEEVASDETFTRVMWDRPPFYPVRQWVAMTAASLDFWYPWFGGVWCTYDAGIADSFDRSMTAQDLRREIVDQQWWSPCMAYILIDVEPALLVVTAVPPEPFEVVAGLGRVDLTSGRETRVWAVQKVEASTTYPNTVVGTFFVDFMGWGTGVEIAV